MPQGSARRRALPRRRGGGVAGVAALLVAGCGGTSSTAPTPSSSPSVDYVVHQDRGAGFAIDYPRSWHFLQSVDPRFKDLQLLVGPEATTYASVRLVAEAAVPQDVASERAVVDKLLAGVTVVDETRVDVQGLKGFQAVYAVPGLKPAAVHIHVFLFEPARVDTIVFETPQASLATYAAIFDHMRDSFRSIPVTPSPGASAPASSPAAAPAIP